MKITKKTKGVLPIEGVDLTGKIIIINSKVLKPEFREGKYQLKKAIDGFGCSPTARGTAVYAESLSDGQRNRWERYDVIGIASDELVKTFFADQTVTEPTRLTEEA